ncbi:hypothetical protein QTP70_016849, partial [Hemibagrus guttatus]
VHTDYRKTCWWHCRHSYVDDQYWKGQGQVLNCVLSTVEGAGLDELCQVQVSSGFNHGKSKSNPRLDNCPLHDEFHSTVHCMA